MKILIRPLVTEKVSRLNETGVYGFVVDRNANKIAIKKEVESAYGVNVEWVNTMRYFGKKRSRYTKSRVVTGATSDFKKALVKLAEGEVIDFTVRYN